MVRPHFASSWWRDVVTLERGGGLSWFNAEVVRKVHDGVDTSFWYAAWRGVFLSAINILVSLRCQIKKRQKWRIFWRFPRRGWFEIYYGGVGFLFGRKPFSAI